MTLHTPAGRDNDPVIPSLEQCALLLDIDGTLLDFAATPREVWVPPELRKALGRLVQSTDGALAMVSGRSINDVDLIFAPQTFPIVGGHGAEIRLTSHGEPMDWSAPKLSSELKKRLAAVAQISPGILVEDKGYALALHFRLAPEAGQAVFDAVAAIHADMPDEPISVLPGKSVCEIKHVNFTKASGVMELMRHAPFHGRTPVFLGDDVTDETVFEIMPELSGLAFSVGRRVPGVNGYFDAPANVRAWLGSLIGDVE